jgi:hypothetical protein
LDRVALNSRPKQPPRDPLARLRLLLTQKVHSALLTEVTIEIETAGTVRVHAEGLEPLALSPTSPTTADRA